MRCLKSGCRGWQIFMSLYNRWLVIPAVLKKKVIINGCLIFCILAAGIFMEWNNEGEGFLKLTIICTIGLTYRFLCLLRGFMNGKYEVLNGEIVRIEICKKKKKYWEVTVRTETGEEDCFLLPAQSGVHKGTFYQFYWQKGELLGWEEPKIG